MAVNVTRFRADLDRLVQASEQLENVMSFETATDEQVKPVSKRFNKDKNKIVAFIKELPKFRVEYEKWYSDSLAIVRQLLPDRAELSG
jgi:hypothetical protein